MSFLISDALAEAVPAAAAQPGAAGGGIMSILPMILLLGLFMYFMVIRPQSKRAKEHKSLIDGLQKGDEVVTIGGVIGVIEKVTEGFILLKITEQSEILIQKSAVASLLPRGTIKGVN